MEIPLLQGRLFNAQDTRADAARGDRRRAHGAAVVARRGPDRQAHAATAASTPAHAPWITVVGVVGNIKQDALDVDSRMAMYLAQTQAARARSTSSSAATAIPRR